MNDKYPSPHPRPQSRLPGRLAQFGGKAWTPGLLELPGLSRRRGGLTPHRHRSAEKETDPKSWEKRSY